GHRGAVVQGHAGRTFAAIADALAVRSPQIGVDALDAAAAGGDEVVALAHLERHEPVVVLAFVLGVAGVETADAVRAGRHVGGQFRDGGGDAVAGRGGLGRGGLRRRRGLGGRRGHVHHHVVFGGRGFFRGGRRRLRRRVGRRDRRQLVELDEHLAIARRIDG